MGPIVITNLTLRFWTFRLNLSERSSVKPKRSEHSSCTEQMLCAVHVSTTTVTYIDPRCIHVSCLPAPGMTSPKLLIFGDIIIPHCLGCTCLSIGELVKTYLILYQVTELPGDKWHLTYYYIYWPVMNRATHDQSQQWIIQVFLILPLLQTEPISQTESKVKVWWTWVKKWWFWMFK